MSISNSRLVQTRAAYIPTVPNLPSTSLSELFQEKVPPFFKIIGKWSLPQRSGPTFQEKLRKSNGISKYRCYFSPLLIFEFVDDFVIYPKDHLLKPMFHKGYWLGKILLLQLS